MTDPREPRVRNAEDTILELHARIERLRMFLGEIAAMGPADEEWDADTLEGAVALAKRALDLDGP